MPGGERLLLLAVALMSGAALGYELLLLRFFSLMYWSHFAHLIISMALLDFGVSGTILAVFQDRLVRYFHRSFFLSALLFVLTLLTATSMAGRLGFNPPEVIWDGGQLGRLAAVFSLVTLPFSCAGRCIGLTLRWQTRQVARVYRADLVGAACGALLIMALLFFLPPENTVRVLALAGLAAAFLGGSGEDKGPWSRRTCLAVVTLLIVLWPAQWLAPVMSPFKGLSQARHIPGVRMAERTFSPAGDFTALTSETIPFRFAPGLSMLAPATPPEQVALFHDGHPAGAIHRGSGGPEAMEFMRWTPMALPYVLLERPRVLVLGAGGGGDVWHALLEKALQVDAVEPRRELAFIQKFVLFLNQPMIAMAVVVLSFLFFAGCGSGYAERLADRATSCRPAWLQDRPVALAVGAIVVVSAVYLCLLPLVFRLGAAWPDTLRITISSLLDGHAVPAGTETPGTQLPRLRPLCLGRQRLLFGHQHDCRHHSGAARRL